MKDRSQTPKQLDKHGILYQLHSEVKDNVIVTPDMILTGLMGNYQEDNYGLEY